MPRYNDCEPTLGWGKFDLAVSDDHIDVIIKCFFDHDRTLGGVDYDEFLDNWQGAVARLWDDKIRLRRSDGRETDALPVRFQLRRSVDLDGAHFPVYIKGGGYAAGAGLYFPQPGLFGGNRMHLKLGTLDNQTWLEGSRMNIEAGVPGARARMFMDQTERVVQSLPGNGHPGFASTMDITMNLANGVWSVSPGDQPALQAICASLADTPPWLPQPAVRISCSSGVQQKINSIATNVFNYMIQHGVAAVSIDRNPILTRKKFKNPFRDHRTTKAVTIELLPVPEMVKRTRAGQAVADNVVSAHEFGHLLGLPDEYLNYSVHMAGSQVMVQSQPKWDALCGRHVPRVTPRAWNDAYNDSMMSVGTTIYRAHAVTLWQCLQTNSGQGWTIVSPMV